MEKILSNVPNWLDKADDRRLGYMAASLLLLIDSASLLTGRGALLSLTAADFGVKITLGSAVAFAVGALVFFSIASPLAFSAVAWFFWVTGIVPSFRRNDSEAVERRRRRMNNRHYVSSSRLLSHAVAADNKVALAVIERHERDLSESSRDSDSREGKAFALLLALLINACTTSSLLQTLMSNVAEVGGLVRCIEIVALLAMLGVPLVEGIVHGCGFLHEPDDGRIYLPDHGMKLPGVPEEDPLAEHPVHALIAAASIGGAPRPDCRSRATFDPDAREARRPFGPDSSHPS